MAALFSVTPIFSYIFDIFSVIICVTLDVNNDMEIYVKFLMLLLLTSQSALAIVLPLK